MNSSHWLPTLLVLTVFGQWERAVGERTLVNISLAPSLGGSHGLRLSLYQRPQILSRGLAFTALCLEVLVFATSPSSFKPRSGNTF